MVLYIIAWLVTFMCLTVPQGTSATSCTLVYGEWTSCSPITQQQTRSVSCLCQKRTVDLRLCKNQIPENTTRDCVTETTTSDDSVCRWKWTKWSKCTARCEAGNTTRTQVCICTNGVNGPDTGPVNDDMCEAGDYYGDETSPCNQFECESVPLFNKIYWTITRPWPMNDASFNCTKSDSTQDSPKDLKYSDILHLDPSTQYNKEWYYLAKEWIAYQLNLANGAQPLPSSIPINQRVTELLEYCDKLPATYKEIFTLKEKLGRINNNIGGLSNVDEQMAMWSSNHEQTQESGEKSAYVMTSFVLMAVIIPLVVLLIVVLVALAVMYRYRKQTYTEVEGAGPSVNIEMKQQAGVGGGDSSGAVIQREQFESDEDEE
eukprot:TRINITY_DN1649_c0_g1_i1.p1 TRINITY_DN1649_c0_g1~~TRINITY_DN1649_c0_g1_i1.p1  ORF type:complete len:374 (-),score=73.11 TRINITY_DN1649_c0_g1_i1:189-1310(-)